MNSIRLISASRGEHRRPARSGHPVSRSGRRQALAIHPNTGQRIKAYVEAAKHGADLDGPLFRPLRKNRKHQGAARAMHPDAIDWVLRPHAKSIGLGAGYPAHSMRATFMTTALENGCRVEKAGTIPGRGARCERDARLRQAEGTGLSYSVTDRTRDAASQPTQAVRGRPRPEAGQGIALAGTFRRALRRGLVRAGERDRSSRGSPHARA
jgi:hypothetical protein